MENSKIENKENFKIVNIVLHTISKNFLGNFTYDDVKKSYNIVNSIDKVIESLYKVISNEFFVDVVCPEKRLELLLKYSEQIAMKE